MATTLDMPLGNFDRQQNYRTFVAHEIGIANPRCEVRSKMEWSRETSRKDGVFQVVTQFLRSGNDHKDAIKHAGGTLIP